MMRLQQGQRLRHAMFGSCNLKQRQTPVLSNKDKRHLSTVAAAEQSLSFERPGSAWLVSGSHGHMRETALQRLVRGQRARLDDALACIRKQQHLLLLCCVALKARSEGPSASAAVLQDRHAQ